MKRIFALAVIIAALTTAAKAEPVKLAVTTSFQNSGLSDVLLPAIHKDIGLEVQLLAVGTGQAIKLGRSGDVDAILVHSKEDEEAFVGEGYGTYRREIMYNDFIIVGPSSDQAAVASADNVQHALKKIANSGALFVSRGDKSGTHKKEMDLWSQAGFDPTELAERYRVVGAGMGAALNIASGLNAYTLADRGSWLNFANKGELAMLYSGDSVLFNQYTFIRVDTERHGHIDKNLAIKLEEWLISDRARELIDSYSILGQQLFFFNAI